MQAHAWQPPALTLPSMQKSMPAFSIELDESSVTVPVHVAASRLVKALKDTAEDGLHKNVSSVVVAVPVDFEQSQLDDLKFAPPSIHLQLTFLLVNFGISCCIRALV